MGMFAFVVGAALILALCLLALLRHQSLRSLEPRRPPPRTTASADSTAASSSLTSATQHEHGQVVSPSLAAKADGV